MEVYKPYIVLIKSFFIPQLLREDARELSKPFRFLMKPGPLRWFVENGEVEGFELLLDQPTNPFVPCIGEVKLSLKSQGLRKDGLVQLLSEIMDSGDIPEGKLLFGLPFDGDDTLAHIPLSLELRRKVMVVSGDSPLDKGEKGRRPHFGTRIHLHLFPYGWAAILACVAIENIGILSLTELSRTIEWLRSRDPVTRKQAMVRIPHEKFKGSFQEMLDSIAQRVYTAIVQNKKATEPLMFPSYVAVHFLHYEEQEPGPKELRGLLSGEPETDLLSEQFIGNTASVFGKYATDLIMPGGGRLVVGTLAERETQGRNFFWHLLSILELALSQRDLYPYFTKVLKNERVKALRIRHKAKPHLKKFFKLSIINLRWLAFLLNVSDYHSNLPASFRKWYHILASQFDLRRRLEKLGRALDSFQAIAETWEAPVVATLKLVGRVLRG